MPVTFSSLSSEINQDVSSDNNNYPIIISHIAAVDKEVVDDKV